MKELDENRIYEGHRKRMKEKLARYDGDIFLDHELLEMLLFFRLPYKDTKPIAKRLLHTFGGLRGVFSADAAALSAISGIGDRCAEFLTAVGNLFSVECCDGRVDDKCRCLDEGDVAELIHSHFSENPDATFVTFAFDNANRLISADMQYGADIGAGSLGAIYYTDFALKTSASLIVTASNRRYGAPIPLPADRESVTMITRALEAVDVCYGDHIIFSGDSYARVMPTMYPNRSGAMPTCGTVKFEPNKNAENVNNNSHNEAVYAAIDSVLESVGAEHFEMTSRLLDRFSRLGDALTADYDALCRVVEPRYALFVRLLSCIAKRRMLEGINPTKLATERDLCEYLYAACYGTSRETLFLISYGADGSVISVDKVAEGTLNSSSVLPRSVIELALRNKAKSVSVAHNHPYGRGELSREDIAFTASLTETLIGVGIVLNSHYCVALDGVFCVSTPFENL